MGRKLGRKKSRKRGVNFHTDNGYLMLSTLFLLVLVGLLMQSVVKISSNYIVQLNQIASSYQAKTALNLTEASLYGYIVNNNNQLPEKGELSTSVGPIKVKQTQKNKYRATLTQENGIEYTKIFKITHIETNEAIEINDERQETNKENTAAAE